MIAICFFTRCVSYSLDRIWGDVSSDESAVTSFAKLTSYCFYLPTGVMGPLITYKKYHDSLSAAVRPLDRGWLRSSELSELFLSDEDGYLCVEGV